MQVWGIRRCSSIHTRKCQTKAKSSGESALVAGTRAEKLYMDVCVSTQVCATLHTELPCLLLFSTQKTMHMSTSQHISCALVALAKFFSVFFSLVLPLLKHSGVPHLLPPSTARLVL